MRYRAQLSSKALKALKQIDRRQKEVLVAWIEKNLDGCQDPRQHGKPLSGEFRGYWRCRVGAYRIIAVIIDDTVRIDIIHIGHRRDIHENTAK